MYVLFYTIIINNFVFFQHPFYKEFAWRASQTGAENDISMKYYTHFDSILLSLYKVNWICFLTSMRLKRSWADSTFNIYLCDAALCCLLSYPLLYTHKFIYFPPFFRCSLCDFTIWLQKNDFSFHKWPFHSNINIICRLICYWFFFSVLGFFMVDVFVSGLLK